MNINGLDDQSLLVIFDIFAVEDLLRAGRVCSRWKFIRAKSALSRHSLTLLVGENARDKIDNSKLDNIPYGHMLTDDESGDDDDDDEVMPPMLCKECADRRNKIVRTKLTSLDGKFITRLFPNITNLTVSIKSETKSVHSLIRLLKLWSTTEPKLTTLKLYTCDQRSKKQLLSRIGHGLVSANHRLLSSLNSITSLRVLILDIDSLLVRYVHKDNRYICDIKFTILNQLERFCLSSIDSHWIFSELVDSLVQFETANERLNEIGINIEHKMKEEDNLIDKISPELARRFTQMCLRMDDSNISLFSPFCERFSNLTTIQLILTEDEVQFSLLELFRPIDSLTQLINLTIKTSILNFDILNFPSAFKNKMIWLHRPNRTSSVKVLKLQVIAEQFDEDDPLIFYKLYLSDLFPSVQVFILENISIGFVKWTFDATKARLYWCTNGFENIKMIQSINRGRWRKLKITSMGAYFNYMVIIRIQSTIKHAFEIRTGIKHSTGTCFCIVLNTFPSSFSLVEHV